SYTLNFYSCIPYRHDTIKCHAVSNNPMLPIHAAAKRGARKRNTMIASNPILLSSLLSVICGSIMIDRMLNEEERPLFWCGMLPVRQCQRVAFARRPSQSLGDAIWSVLWLHDISGRCHGVICRSQIGAQFVIVR